MNLAAYKPRVFSILNQEDSGDRLTFFVNLFIIVLILLSVASIILGSFEEIYQQYGLYLHYFDLFSVIIFSFEYAGRVWTADYLYPSLSPADARKKFVFSPLAFLDLLAILSVYLPMFFPFDLVFLRIFRLFRVIRIFKLRRYNTAVSTIIQVIRDQRAELGVAFFASALMLIVFSILMYYLEHDAQPEYFSNFLTSFWWVLSSVSQVAYVTFDPVTVAGRFLGAFIGVFAIGIIVVPAGILTAGFNRVMRDQDQAGSGDK